METAGDRDGTGEGSGNDSEDGDLRANPLSSYDVSI